MRTRMLGVLAVSSLLGAALTTPSFAQERQRGFDGPRGDLAGQMRAGPRGRGGPAQPERFIERHDTDADGRVGEMEFVDDRLQNIDELFDRRDADGNGLISADEHDAPRGLRGRGARGERPALADRPERAARPEIDRDAVTACVRETIADYEPRFDNELDDIFEHVDTNGDDMLSLQEVSAAVEARAGELFDRIDDNGDGYITEDEVEAHFEAQLNVRRVVNACIKEQVTG